MRKIKNCFNLFIISMLISSFSILTGCSDKDDKIGPDDPPRVDAEARLFEELNMALVRGISKNKGKGASAAIILPDGKIWSASGGVSHGRVYIKAYMPFSAGSIAKSFTAVTVLQLVEAGALSLDDPLYKWLTAYPNVDSTITVRQLLNHTGGLNDIADNPGFWEEVLWNPSKWWEPEDIVFKFNGETVFPKGTDWNYSTSGYILLRLIVEKITGSDICMEYADRFFVKYNLSNSFAYKGGSLPSGTVHGWFDLNSDGNYDDFYQLPRTAFASGICGEVFSTAEDLAKWARFLYHDRKVLSSETMDEMLEFYSPCTGEEFMCSGYGLGAMRFNPDILNGLLGIGHSGNAPGYAAASVYFPEYNICLGIVDNTEEGNSMYVINSLMDIVLNYLKENS